MNFIIASHIFSCFFMTGVIWIVQILLYPLFKKIDEKNFQLIHQFHINKITFIVAPIMVLEIATAIYLLYLHQNLIFLINLFSVITLWILTAIVNVPSHNRLNYNSEKSKNDLVNFNWSRTVIWTLRSVFLIYFFF